MGREPLLKRIAALINKPCGKLMSFGINSRFQELFPTWGQVTHVFLTLAPLISGLPRFTVRLACLIHAASVRSEPESNSPNKIGKSPEGVFYILPIESWLAFNDSFVFLEMSHHLNYDLDFLKIWLGSSHYSNFQGTSNRTQKKPESLPHKTKETSSCVPFEWFLYQPGSLRIKGLFRISIGKPAVHRLTQLFGRPD